MEATLYKITIGTKNALILSINAADALESIDSKSGTRSLEVAGKATFSLDDSGRISSYKLKSATHQPKYGCDAIISHGVRASMAQEAALKPKPVVLSQHETKPNKPKSVQRAAKPKNHTKKPAKNEKSPLNPKFFISGSVKPSVLSGERKESGKVGAARAFE